MRYDLPWGGVMMVTTWQARGGAVIHLTPEQEEALASAGVWPKDERGQEYCSVSHGLHEGEPTFPKTERLLAWCGVTP